MFLALTTIVISQYYRTKVVEGLYLTQIQIDADMVNSYARIIANTNLDEKQKLVHIVQFNSVNANSVADQMDAVFKAYGRQVPVVCKQLKVIGGAVSK
jgi:hypothetical protein